ncbi:hypothetical protein WDW89_02745 [Deltaproteobacteria bacterium TL4]
MKMHNSPFWLYFGMWLLVLLDMSCSLDSKEFSTRYSEGYQVEGYAPTNTAATGTACARQYRDAADAAKNAALFNLRSVVGNYRYVIHYRESRRFQKGSQTCIEMIAIAREP